MAAWNRDKNGEYHGAFDQYGYEARISRVKDGWFRSVYHAASDTFILDHTFTSSTLKTAKIACERAIFEHRPA